MPATMSKWSATLDRGLPDLVGRGQTVIRTPEMEPLSIGLFPGGLILDILITKTGECQFPQGVQEIIRLPR